ncbi:MAG: S49 family peptidase, partial [Methylococcaceae bacterium]
MDKRYDDLHKANATQDANWEHTVIEKIALAAITEQTRARRWSVFFKSLAFCYLTIVLGITLYPVLKKDMNIDSKEHTAV